MDPEIVTCLWFDGGHAAEAAAFYVANFPRSRLGAVSHAGSEYPGGRQGDVLTVEFTLLGQRFFGLNGGAGIRPSEAVSFQVLTSDQAETDRYWDTVIGHGGAESQCGWCRDRWGFSWQIVPRALMAGLNDADPAAAKRVMDAMMTMRRIDIAAIEAARAGHGSS